MALRTRITTPFGASTTAAEVIADVDLRGKRAIVTGAASGIGPKTSRALASAGAEVTLAVRNPETARPAAEDIIASSGNPNVRPSRLDVANWHGPPHILVDNAGIMASPELRTRRGWELQFATNHLGILR